MISIVHATLIKAWITSIEIGLRRNFLRPAKRFSEALVVDDFTLAKEFYRIAHIWIVNKSKQVVIGHAGLLLCYYHVFATKIKVCKSVVNPYFTMGFCTFRLTRFSEIPMDFNGHISSAFNTLSDHDFVDQNLYHFPCQMLHIDILLNEFSSIIAYGNFDVDLRNLFSAF